MVAVEPSYCHQCGAELVARELDGRARKVCPECGHRHFLNAVPAVDVIVRKEGTVLLLDPAEGGAWELPGGHPEVDERPAAAAARELEEETGLAARPADLELLSVLHSPYQGRHYYMITYVLEYAATTGRPAAGAEATALAFWSTDRVRAYPDRTRRIDREAIDAAFNS